MTLTRAAAKRLTDRVLAQASVDDVVVQVHAEQAGNSRFANNAPTTNGDVAQHTVRVTATVEGRSATLSTTRTDAASLGRLVRAAEETARLAPPDPEHMPPLGPQKYVSVAGHDAGTARLGAEQRASAIGAPIALARERGLVGSGLVTHAESAWALANTAGLFAYHPATEISMSNTCRTTDGTGSGRAAFISHRYAALDARAVAQVAAEKAEMSVRPRALDPGKYVVVLEPEAVWELMSFLVHALDARAADEGRSYFARPGGGNRIGETLFHTSVDLSSDPGDVRHPASPIAADGLAHGKVTWIEKGVLRTLSHSRWWADRQGIKPLPSPSSVHMAGTDATLAELIAGVDRGIVVTRFWYNRMLEPRTILATGLTRDGTFLVEQGKITTAVKNFRYNESPVTLLKNVLALGRPERVPTRGDRVVVVPPLVVEGFHFASQSDAV